MKVHLNTALLNALEKIDCFSLNSVDPDKMPCYVAFHHKSSLFTKIHI